MAKITIPMQFVNVWKSNKGLQPHVYFKGMHYLLNKYRFDLSHAPQVVFSINNNNQFRYGNCTRVFFAGENIRPKMSACDWAFGFECEDAVNNARYMRLPNYVRLGAGTNLLKGKPDVAAMMSRRTKFCAFVSRNPTKPRVDLVRALSKYKRVDAAGPLMKNGPLVEDYPHIKKKNQANKYSRKVEFYQDYKFVIAVENETYPGYTTEKLYHGMLSGTPTIYWGNPLIKREFNTKSFINCHDVKLKTLDQQIDYLVERVIELDNDDDLYAKMLLEPYYHGNKLNKYADPRRIMHRFHQILVKP